MEDRARKGRKAGTQKREGGVRSRVAFGPVGAEKQGGMIGGKILEGERQLFFCGES